MKLSTEKQYVLFLVGTIIILPISIVIHELGHWISYTALGIESEIIWSQLVTRAALDTPTKFELWFENWIIISAAGGLLAFAVLLPFTWKLHPSLTWIPWTQLIYGILEPVNTWSTRLGCGHAYNDIAISVVAIAFGTLITIFVVFLSFGRSNTED